MRKLLQSYRTVSTTRGALLHIARPDKWVGCGAPPVGGITTCRCLVRTGCEGISAAGRTCASDRDREGLGRQRKLGCLLCRDHLAGSGSDLPDVGRKRFSVHVHVICLHVRPIVVIVFVIVDAPLLGCCSQFQLEKLDPNFDGSEDVSARCHVTYLRCRRAYKLRFQTMLQLRIAFHVHERHIW